MNQPSTIGSLNLLPEDEKRRFYGGLIPQELIDRFRLPPSLLDAQGRSLLRDTWQAGTPTVELALFHEADFPDPVVYGHLADTMNGQIHVLPYVLNDPASPRFDVDKLPDGRSTRFGTLSRNLDAEASALAAGLAPGQVRRGLRLLGPLLRAFENFVAGLGHNLYFVEPLYYHNAVIFEHYGFAYQQGRILMERIQRGFSAGGDLLARLDGSTFRAAAAAQSIRLRSWSIHDGVLGDPFTHVTMYKRVGKEAGMRTTGDATW